MAFFQRIFFFFRILFSILIPLVKYLKNFLLHIFYKTGGISGISPSSRLSLFFMIHFYWHHKPDYSGTFNDIFLFQHYVCVLLLCQPCIKLSLIISNNIIDTCGFQCCNKLIVNVLNIFHTACFK